MIAVCIGGGFVIALGAVALRIKAYGWSPPVVNVLIALTAAVIAWGSWMASVKLVFHENGLQYRSLFGSRVLLWDDVEGFLVSARKHRLGFKFRWKDYSYLTTIIACDGRRLRFGDRFSEPLDLARSLIEITTERLYLRARGEFECGRAANFGYIKVTRKDGIRMTPLWRSPVTIPLNHVESYSVSKGHVHVRQRGSEKPVAVPFDCVLNPFALMRLLDVIYARPTPTVVSVDDWYE